jgi:hypothetical protein
MTIKWSSQTTCQCQGRKLELIRTGSTLPYNRPKGNFISDSKNKNYLQFPFLTEEEESRVEMGAHCATYFSYRQFLKPPSAGGIQA